LAQQLGTNYRALMYWLRGDRPIPAELLPQICVLLKQTSAQEFQVISNLMKDVGSALESMAGALADGVVNENELNATIPKLKAVIRDCASLKYLLETHSKNKKKRAKP
jgi:hypothetical protein